MANVKRLEVAYAEEKQLREKIINDRDKIIEENVSLSNQIEELKRKLESVTIVRNKIIVLLFM